MSLPSPKSMRRSLARALTAGKIDGHRIYKGKGRLHERKRGKDCLCVWGVACEIFQRRIGGLEITTDHGGGKIYDGHETSPPEKVCRAFGLANDDATVTIRRHRKPEAVTLMGLNDRDGEHWNFRRLAKLFNRQPITALS